MANAYDKTEWGLESPDFDCSNWISIFKAFVDMAFHDDYHEKITLFFSLANKHGIYPEIAITTNDLLSSLNAKNIFHSFWSAMEMTIFNFIEYEDNRAEIPNFLLSLMKRLDADSLTVFFSQSVRGPSDYCNVTVLYTLFCFCLDLVKRLDEFSFHTGSILYGTFGDRRYFILLMQTLTYVLKTCDEKKIIDAFFGKLESSPDGEEISCVDNLKKMTNTVWSLIKKLCRTKFKIQNDGVEKLQSTYIIFLCALRDRFRDQFSDDLYKWLSVKIKKIGTRYSFSVGALPALVAAVALPAMNQPRIVLGELKPAIPFDVWMIIFSFRYGLSYEALKVLACSERKAYQYPRLFFSVPKQVNYSGSKISDQHVR